MNKSVAEIDVFLLQQGDPRPEHNFPYPFWVTELEKFVGGGGCEAKVPPVVHCPNDMWRSVTCRGHFEHGDFWGVVLPRPQTPLLAQPPNSAFAWG